MAVQKELPSFDLGANQQSLDAFKNLTRPIQGSLENQKGILPTIRERAAEANRITESIADMYRDGCTDPRLEILQGVDQGLLLTPFDAFDGMRVEIAPEEIIENWRIQHEFNLMLANHPTRIEGMKAVEERGFQTPPPLNEDNAVLKAFQEGTILQLSDLGQNIDLTTFKETPTYIAESQVHRSEQFALGIPVMQGKQVRSFFGGAAMPDINGSALSVATQAMMHMRVDLPEVGFFSNPERQANLAEAVFSILDNHPLLDERSPEEQAWLKEHWKGNVFGALEAGTTKALRRAEKLAEKGVTSFRVYGHTQGIDAGLTVQALRREYPNAEIHASQITDLGLMFDARDKGADAIITGVGSGGRCTTADQAQSIPANALLPILARQQGFDIPIIAEGGAIDEPVVAALVGLSGVNGSGSIGGGTLESPGGMYYLKKDGKYHKPYGGEASPRTKWLSGRIFPTGLPYFPEGEQTFRDLDPLEASIAQKVITHQQRFILGPVTLRIEATPFIIEAMQGIIPSPLFRKSPTTFELQKTH